MSTPELEAYALDLLSKAYDGNGSIPVFYWAIANGLTDSDRAKQKAAEQWIVSKGWGEKTTNTCCMLTYTGRLEVERRRANNK